jgi:hypothetical protein
MPEYNSIFDTMAHINKVRENCEVIIKELRGRELNHDKTKMESPEKEVFDKYTPLLSQTVYGSEEYMRNMREMKPAIEHHHQNNRHHPEHFANGIRGMNLVDIVEMFCDWMAATQRNKDGDIMKSIEIGQARFHYSDDLKAILENTYKDIFEKQKAQDESGN